MISSTPPAAPPPHRPGHVVRRGRVAAIVGVVSLALVLSGCSSSSGGADPATTDGPAGTAPMASGGSAPTTPSTAPGADSGSDERSGDGETTSSSTEQPTLSTVDLEPDEVPYAEAMTAQGTGGFSTEQGRCIAGHTIQAIGVDAVAAAGITPELLASGDRNITDVSLDRATADRVVAGFEACGVDATTFVMVGFVGPTGGDPTKEACIEAALTPELARAYMVDSMANAATEAPVALADVQAIMARCLG